MNTDSPLALMPRPVADTLSAACEHAASHAPYLARLLRRDGGALDLTSLEALAASCEAELEALCALASDPPPPDDLMRELRIAKRRVHLALALLDLTSHWPLHRITWALTELAERSLRAALSAALAARGLSGRGIFLFAFGKMGAYELNYSSDIDVAAFYDPDLFDGGEKGAQDASVRVIREVCRIMEAQTEDGYVFRTDLRLRPDPGSTPVAVSTRRAELYYESVGQNWERMAWIKARACAGDLDAAAGFSETLRPFIWRRHLDYWALADIHSIKRMINANVGEGEISAAGCDVKLGPGGIREVEFFAQTQQIILGGRDERLRTRGTVEAISALRDIGVVAPQTASQLLGAYEALRGLEHRIQMVHDDQTHTLPASETERAAVAALMGFSGTTELDAALLSVRRGVHAIYRELFASEEGAAAGNGFDGNLVFTGVDDDPGTLKTLSDLGFQDPSRVIGRFRNWHFGHVPATRTRRGQELLTAITPRLLKAMSATGEASTAFQHFERFFEGLRSGVQLLAMLNAEQDLLDDLVLTLAIAPRLARILAARPALLEALVASEETGPPVLPTGLSFEEAMDRARRLHRDETFLIGHRLLHGRLAARDAGEAWTALARLTVDAMTRAALDETARRFGPVPGRLAVMGMGSFGAREMTASSDLDLIVIFDPAGDGEGDAQTWFTRFTQRLMTALTSPTAEGLLYEVDMRLRPSGRAGPVAVRLSAFRKYQADEAWTWEHMALTRMAPVAGDGALASEVLAAAASAIEARKGRETVPTDIADMRERLRRERQPASVWDMKLSDGGLVDIEFIAQRGLLVTGGDSAIFPHTSEALAHLERTGWLAPEAGRDLRAAWQFQSALRQLLRLAIDGDVTPDMAFSIGLRDRLCRAVGADRFDDVQAELAAHRARVMQLA